MSRDAVKFTDLDAFLSATEQMGYNGEMKSLIYEEGKLPYCSAYIIPTDALPSSFNINSIDQFGGSLIRVQDISYNGNEQFTTDFMIFPQSLSGYVEEEISNSPIFTQGTGSNEWAIGEMNYVINLEDGGGQEFYLSTGGTLLSLSSSSQDEPHLFKTHKQVNKQMESLREKYPATCRIYAVEARDFEDRRKALLKPPTS